MKGGGGVSGSAWGSGLEELNRYSFMKTSPRGEEEEHITRDTQGRERERDTEREMDRERGRERERNKERERDKRTRGREINNPPKKEISISPKRCAPSPAAPRGSGPVNYGGPTVCKLRPD